MSTVLVSVLCFDPHRQGLNQEGNHLQRDATGNGKDKGGRRVREEEEQEGWGRWEGRDSE